MTLKHIFWIVLFSAVLGTAVGCAETDSATYKRGYANGLNDALEICHPSDMS